MISLAFAMCISYKVIMETTFFKNHELLDKEIVTALKPAAKDYEDGAILEARDALADIVQSIDEFSNEN